MDMNIKSAQRFNIYLYINYRNLLKDYYTFQKKEARSFSYRYFAIKSGVTASLFKDIIEGRRRLSLEVMHKYSTAMNLTSKEIDYFSAVVQFINSKTTEDKNFYYTIMLRLRGSAKLKLIDKGQYDFFKNWYHSALRELITLPNFKEDYEWMAKCCIPKITAAQAKKSIEIMLSLGLLRRNEIGVLIPSDTVISSECELKSLTVRNYHAEMIGLAKDALDRFEPGEREISSLTAGVSQRCYDRMKERIRSFKHELLNMTIDDTSKYEIVCQCNFQLFPLVEKSIPKLEEHENE
jgi:uncharacterized protein (TIGR02147 family)